MSPVLNKPLQLSVDAASVSGKSPWDCLMEIRDRIAGQPLMIWESRGGEALVGIGALWSVEASGLKRFRAIRESLRVLEETPEAFAFGGFAFAPQGSSAWPGFPDGLFYVPKATFRRPSDRQETFATRWSSNAESGEAAFSDRKPSGAPMDRDAWSDAVRRTLGRIREGALTKAVLARSVSVPLPPGHGGLELYASLRAAYPEANRYLIDDGRGRAFLGATPERLVSLVDTTVTTEAVAGTVRCGEGDDAEALGKGLLASVKDRNEHDPVLHHLREALQPISIGPVRYDQEPEILRLPHLLHLRTRVSASLRARTHVLDLVERLHPTPAVAGWPQREALEWIAATEPEDRGWYAGPIGWVDGSGCGDFAVGIRSISIHDGQARVFAGAGIVEGSDPEQEWNETELKMKGILDAIARD